MGLCEYAKKASESTEKTTKDRAEERSEAGKTYLFFCQRKVVKNRWNVEQKWEAGNKTFPTKTGELESL